MENQTTVPATPITKQENRRPEIIFVSQTKGPLTLEKLSKSTKYITARLEQSIETCQNLRHVLFQYYMTDNPQTNKDDQDTVKKELLPEIQVNPLFEETGQL